MGREDRIQASETLLKRFDVLEQLCQAPMYIRDLVEETGQSRSTINRAINDLEAIDLVEQGDDGIEATTTGRIARAQMDTFLAGFDDVRTAGNVLDALPSGTDLSPDAVAGCEPVLATDPAPYRPLELIYDDLLESERYRALVPTIEDPRHVRLLYEHVVTEGNPAELVVPPDVFRTLAEEFPRRMAAMAEEDGFSVFVGAVPPFGLGLFERETGTETTVTAQVIVHNESGGVHGTLVNEAEPAIGWAEDRYVATRNDATERTSELLDDPGADERATDPDGGLASIGQSLPASLEREGFVSVDVSYFRDEPVADPATAWRAGLSLAEVHTGYAVPQPRDTARSSSSVDGDGDLASAITSELAAGDGCVVVGPPGSGKSTICKAVACKWYDADHGPVLYREHDRGRALGSVEDLVATVTAADGHALVVVEDAVRPDADRVFDAIDRLGERDDVSFLLDSRESEWRAYSERPGTASDLEVVHVPPMSEASCERLVEHFERTIGRSVDVSADRLWTAVRDEATTVDDAPNEMLRLIHRLAAYADPLADGPTALEEAVAAVYDAVADDEVALSVCILANALNAAGIGVDRGLLYAVADDGNLGAVDDALDRLEGHVLFSRDDGSDRTVHEEWSTTFLAHLVDVDGDGATRRFGTAVTALLALADDPERCDRIASHLRTVRSDRDDGEWELADVIDEPRAWADEVVESVYVLGRKRSNLAPLFGDGASDSIDLPSACSGGVADERPVWLGRMFLAGGYYDRAERAFERLPREDPDRGPERLLGLARVSIDRGEYDAAIDCCRECLSLVETEARAAIRARARVRLGEALTERGEFAEAETHYETALDEFRAGENRGWEARTRHRIGRVAMERGEFERAREQYESSLEISRELGDRRGEAETLNYMGNIAWNRGAFDRAAGLFERSLELSQELGDRPGVASSLNNLGAIEGQRSNYDRAAEFYERSLELRQELGDRQGVAKCLHNLGHLERQRGDYDSAAEFYERSLERKRELGDRPRVASTLNNLGTLEGRRGNYDRALEWHEQSLELRQEIGDRPGEAKSLANLGTFERMRGNFDRAAEFYEQSLEIVRDLGDRPGVANLLGDLGMLAERRGASERARGYCEEALEIAGQADDSRSMAKSHRCLGATALREGAHERAREHLEDALDAAEEGTPEAMQIRLTRSELALARDDLDGARSIASDVHEEFEAMGLTHWRARSRRLLGRIAAEAGEDESAREQLRDALETFEELGAVHDALATLEALVETHRGGDQNVDQWHDRARELLTEASEAIGERHAAWIEASP